MCVVITMANPRPVKKKRVSKFLVLLLIPALAGGCYFIWKELQSGGLPSGFASGNGRIEATEVDMASKQQFDTDVTTEQAANATWAAAKALIATAEAAIESAAAQIEKVKADIAETILKSPRFGRVEYRLVEPGEVIPAGGKVITLLDVTDVYMIFFSADRPSREGRDRWGRSDRSGCAARIADSCQGVICFAERSVHAEGG